MVELEEQQIVERAQRDPARFADLYDRHFDRVSAFIARRGPAAHGRWQTCSGWPAICAIFPASNSASASSTISL